MAATRARLVPAAAALAVTGCALALLVRPPSPAAADRRLAAGSENVVLIPGLRAADYPDTLGIPPFPAAARLFGRYDLTAYRYGELGFGSITPEELARYDTAVLYGVRWRRLSPAAQTALNDFARTHKLLVWDADSTGAQDYATFLHPFATIASGEPLKSGGSVAAIPESPNEALASPDASSPGFVDTKAVVKSIHLLGHMSVMKAGAGEWSPALIASNRLIPAGGWVVAWAYGSTADRTGLVVYSGIDADAFIDRLTPNYALKELALQLAAPFSQTPAACAPSCAAPEAPAAGSGLGARGTTSAAVCTPTRKIPTRWVRGVVKLELTTSVGKNMRASLVGGDGWTLQTARPLAPGRFRFTLQTTRLRSNGVARLRIVVFVGASRACSVPAPLRVDNRPAVIRSAQLRSQGGRTSLTIVADENATLLVQAAGHTVRRARIVAGRSLALELSGFRRGRLILVDRAGNRTFRRLP
jgi:hypothetical protein